MSTPTIADLQRAVQISEQIEKLEGELRLLLGGIGSGNGETSDQVRAKRRGRPPKAKSAMGEAPLGIEIGNGKQKRKKGGMSAEGRAKIAAAQKARWAKVKGVKSEAVAEPKAKKKKRTLSPEARAKIVAAVKARWARAGSKK